MSIPRDYQAAARDAVFDGFGTNQSVLAVLPTGTGKSKIFGYVAKRFRLEPRYYGKVLLIAHREELITQGQGHLEEETGEHFEIEMAQYHVNSQTLFGGSAGVVASVQSLSRERRISKDVFRPENFGLVIVDEAHHAIPRNQQYHSVIRHFAQNPDCKILGVTATPDRADEEALGQVFQSCVFDMGVIDAIAGGWLVPIRQAMVTVADLDFSKVRTTCGDLNAGDLESVYREEKILHRIVSPTIELAKGRRTLVFAPGVESAHRMAEIFNRHRAGMAVALDGDSERFERRDELKRFARGETQVLVNCGLFLEGTDIPGVEVVAIARATKSRALYAQMIGRGTRPLPGVVDFDASTSDSRRAAIAASGKPACLVVDFMGNAGRHKLVHVGDVLAGRISDEMVEQVNQIARQRATEGLDTDMLAALEQSQREADERRRAERQSIVAKASYVVREIDPFDQLDMASTREPEYMRGKGATGKQTAWLKANGVRNVDGLSMHRASQLIDEVKRRADQGLCNPRVAARLASFGYPTNVTAAQAAQTIREINERLRLQKTSQQPAGAK